MKYVEIYLTNLEINKYIILGEKSSLGYKPKQDWFIAIGSESIPILPTEPLATIIQESSGMLVLAIFSIPKGVIVRSN